MANPEKELLPFLFLTLSMSCHIYFFVMVSPVSKLREMIKGASQKRISYQ
jgi:hypothetical protein